MTCFDESYPPANQSPFVRGSSEFIGELNAGEKTSENLAHELGGVTRWAWYEGSERTRRNEQVSPSAYAPHVLCGCV